MKCLGKLNQIDNFENLQKHFIYKCKTIIYLSIVIML